MKRLCALMLFAATAAGCSNVEVQGIVRDQATGDPLPGATVRVGEDMTETDYRGFYEIEVDEDKAREIMVDKTGYESYSQPVELTGVDQVIQDVELNPSLPTSEQGGLGAPGGLEREPLTPGGVNPEETTAPQDTQGTMSDEFDTGSQNNLQRGRNQGGSMYRFGGGMMPGGGAMPGTGMGGGSR